MSEIRTRALLVTPLLPHRTGLATYALRVLDATCPAIDWTVAYTSGSDPSALPSGVSSLPLERLTEEDIPAARIFQIGNSPHCFPVLQSLYRFGGTVLFHEIVLHHMMRHCYLESNRMEDYMRELRFCYGPAAERVSGYISEDVASPAEFDRRMKCYPLTGRAVHASHSAVFLNPFAASILGRAYPENRILTIGHPLSPLPPLGIPDPECYPCFGMLGTNHPGRNLDLLVDALTLLRTEYPDSGLVLLGEGYPDGLPEWVTRTGRLEEQEYQGWIRALDYVFDIRYPACGETSGSLLEAMRAGIPSIVSAEGSFNNLPSDAVIRVPPDNMVQALQSAVRLLESRPALRKALSENGRIYANETGSEKRLLEDWEKVITLAALPPPEGISNHMSTSLSAAWHEPPAGFTRDITTSAVSWKFDAEAKITGPSDSEEALVTAWGRGTVSGGELPPEPEVLECDGRAIEFSGRGWISNVIWK
jgi:glycosyltransferase involved in cell wall biosynthesis